MSPTVKKYPADINIDYPAQWNKLTVFFRLFLIIPIVIILTLLIPDTYTLDQEDAVRVEYISTVGLVIVPTILMILVRQKYPRWWFNWNLELTKFGTRILAYLLLLMDDYPSTDEEQAVHIEIPYPGVETDLNRWMPLVKWFLAIPHYILLAILAVAVIFCTIIAWLAILFTGKYPKDIYDFVVGVMRWDLRVNAYAFLLTTDVYPPFGLQ